MNNRAKLLSLIDLTSLNQSDDEPTILQLCEKANSPLGHVAAVCVYPQFVKIAVNFFRGQHLIKVATVANFPEGKQTLETALEGIYTSIQNGAKEIDVVFPYHQYLQGDKIGAHKFIIACKEVCGPDILLKVILETGALPDEHTIMEISRHVFLAGADFIKTSTGKILTGATIPAARAMLKVVKEFSTAIPRVLGVKISGGIKTIPQAEEYVNLAAEIMGEDWVSPEHFRIGASQLVDRLIVH